MKIFSILKTIGKMSDEKQSTTIPKWTRAEKYTLPYDVPVKIQALVYYTILRYTNKPVHVIFISPGSYTSYRLFIYSEGKIYFYRVKDGDNITFLVNTYTRGEYVGNFSHDWPEWPEFDHGSEDVFSAKDASDSSDSE